MSKTQPAISFMSSVPTGGFRWIAGPFAPDWQNQGLHLIIGRDEEALKTRIKEGPRRQPNVRGPALVAEAGPLRPIELPADAFLRFVEMDALSEEDVASFASSYGALGLARDLVPVSSPKEPVCGELYSDWLTQNRKLKVAIELYSAIRAKDSKALAKLITIAGARHIEYGKGLNSETVQLPESSRSIGKHEIVLAARVLLQRWINNELDHFARIQVMWTNSFEQLIETITPSGIAGAMWLQFAAAACDASRFISCAGCGRIIPVKTIGDRLQKRTCNAACKQRVHDRRKADARRMAGEGLSAAQIATKLIADVEDVAGWIKKLKPKQQ